MFRLGGIKEHNLKLEFLSGTTVALALVPEAVAFAFVAGVEPMVGLYAAFIMGLITGIFGGRPGMISGATGAMAVVMVALVAQHGVQYLFATIILTGLLQLTAGLFRLGKYIRMVPFPVMLGFVNGLAIVIFLAQLDQFMVKTPSGEFAWMSGSVLFTMAALVALTMLIMHFLPKVSTAVPAALVAIIVVTLLVVGIDLEARSVIDFMRDMVPAEQRDTVTLGGGLPQFMVPHVPFNLATLGIILPYAIILAGVGLIESLLTLTLIDEVTNTRGKANRECRGQGFANMLNGFFGGMGGCAMIGQSMININSGGRTRLSAITAALVLLGFILFASPLIEIIPLAALVGVMFMVVLGTFEWASMRGFGKVPGTDMFIMVLVTVITVAADLAIAVVIGVIVSALVFAWKHAQHIYADDLIDEKGWKIYALHGPLFFGSVANFKDIFKPENDPDDVVIEFAGSRVSDASGIEALDALAEKYLSYGKTLHIRHLSPECRELLKKAGNLCEVNVLEDPDYHVASDELG